MRTYLDCIPCFIRQTLDASRFASDDEQVLEKVLREVLALVGKIDMTQSPPQMGQTIHRIIRKSTQNADPYKQVKERCNKIGLGLYPELKDRLKSAANQIETAVRLAMVGNIIDFGVNSKIDQDVIAHAIDQSLTANIFGRAAHFEPAVNTAQKILYLGDNAGEIVFDRLLMELLPVEKITFCVRGAPILNDVTMQDAIDTGVAHMVDVIDNGSDAPGTVLEQCSDNFKAHFNEADLIISKGQGNFETLSGVDKHIIFLLKAKCPVIAAHVGCQVGDMVIQNVMGKESRIL